MIIMSEFSNLGNSSACSAESIENFGNTSTLLHGNNSELIFFIDPDEERFGIVVEDTSSFWPVSVEVACSQESVSLLEKEMVINELFLSLFAHTSKWVEGSLKISFELLACFNNLSHDFVSLFS
jgi:hypothetical protein